MSASSRWTSPASGASASSATTRALSYRSSRSRARVRKQTSPPRPPRSRKRRDFMKINYPAVFVSALAYWMLGAVWYSPILFERSFIALKAWTPEQGEAARAASHAGEIGAALAISLLTAYVLAHFVKFTGAETGRSGVLAGFWLWLGFVA